MLELLRVTREFKLKKRTKIFLSEIRINKPIEPGETKDNAGTRLDRNETLVLGLTRRSLGTRKYQTEPKTCKNKFK